MPSASAPLRFTAASFRPAKAAVSRAAVPFPTRNQPKSPIGEYVEDGRQTGQSPRISARELLEIAPSTPSPMTMSSNCPAPKIPGEREAKANQQ
jgi:hypothetical protein